MCFSPLERFLCSVILQVACSRGDRKGFLLLKQLGCSGDKLMVFCFVLLESGTGVNCLVSCVWVSSCVPFG